MTSNQKKLLKPLPAEIRSVVRSGIAITSISQCVEELVFNSIDAGARTVQVGVNPELFNVRVEDDGRGFREVDLEAVGARYTTSKCCGMDDLNKLEFYGFRGEAIASIIDVSGTLDIITRPEETEGIELKKKYENGLVSGFVEKCNSKNKKSGTTIVIGKLLSRFPVRQKRIEKSLQLEEVKMSLERISLMNHRINIILRNEQTGKLMFDYSSSNSYTEAFDKLFKGCLGFSVNFVEDHFAQNRLFFKLSISNDFYRKKDFQFVFVNNRFIKRCKIHKWVGCKVLDKYSQESNSSRCDKYPIFVLHVLCPFTEYDITLDPRKQNLEFKDWDSVHSGIEGLVAKLKAKDALRFWNSKSDVQQRNRSFATSYDVKGALHSRIATRDEGTASRNLSNAISVHMSPGRGSGSSGISLTKTDRYEARRTLTRTGKSTHIVDVRAIRREAKTRSKDNSSNTPSPKRVSKRSSVKTGIRPVLTAGILKRFPVWKEELEKAPVVPKRPKLTAQEQPSSSSAFRTNPEQKNMFEANEVCQQSFRSTYSSTDSDTEMTERFSRKKHKKFKTVKARNTSPEAHCSVKSAGCYPNSFENVNSSSSKDLELEEKIHHGAEAIVAMSNTFMKNYLQTKWKTTIADQTRKLAQYLSSYCRQTKEQDKWKDNNRKPSVETQSRCDLNASTSKEAPFSFSLSELNQPAASNSFSIPIVPLMAKTQIVEINNNCGDAVSTNPKSKESKTCAPPLLNLFPLQKLPSTEWNDGMFLDTSSANSDSDIFGSNWDVEIVMDLKGMEWLKTEDGNHKTIYISMSTGECSYDMLHITHCARKVTAKEFRSSNPAKYNWLRKHFPRGFKSFWKGEQREVLKQGDPSKLREGILANTLQNFLQEESKPALPDQKWNEPENFSEYFKKDAEQSFQVVRNVHLSDIQGWKKFGNSTSSFRFSRSDFEHVNVIGQLDKKFILATVRKSVLDNPTLVVFDQHAVHERIRLEKLIEESFLNPKSGKRHVAFLDIDHPYQFALADSEVRIMQNYEDFFKQAGLFFRAVDSTNVKIKTAPKCFFERCKAESLATREEGTKNLIHMYIKELIHNVIDTKGATLTTIPRIVNEVLCSQACHGAIKFGDHLDRERCIDLITSLRKCKSLFQCAHGRPSVAPLITAPDMAKTTALSDSRSLVHSVMTSTGHVCISNHQDCSTYFCQRETEENQFPFDRPNKNLSKADNTNNLNNTSGYFSCFDVTHRRCENYCSNYLEPEFRNEQNNCSDFILDLNNKSKNCGKTDDSENEHSPYFFFK